MGPRRQVGGIVIIFTLYFVTRLVTGHATCNAMRQINRKEVAEHLSTYTWKKYAGRRSHKNTHSPL